MHLMYENKSVRSCLLILYLIQYSVPYGPKNMVVCFKKISETTAINTSGK